MPVLGRKTRARTERNVLGAARRTNDRSCGFAKRFECEHICWDPKDGELCVYMVKTGEIRVEARSDSNVQIDRQIWV